MAQFMSQCEECPALVPNPQHQPAVYCTLHQPLYCPECGVTLYYPYLPVDVSTFHTEHQTHPVPA